jgi:hypothetical protein
MNIKEYQLKETEKEIQCNIDEGAVMVSLDRYKNIFAKYGLTIDLDKKNYLLTYFNTSNSQNYLCATSSFLDSKKISWASTESEWYKEHVIKGRRETQIYKEFKQDRLKYFTTLRSGHILSI